MPLTPVCLVVTARRTTAVALLHRAAAARPTAVPLIPAVSPPAVLQLRPAVIQDAVKTPAAAPLRLRAATTVAATILAAVQLRLRAVTAVAATAVAATPAVVTSESASWPVFAASGVHVAAASPAAVLQLRPAAARPSAVLRPVPLLVATAAFTKSNSAGIET